MLRISLIASLFAIFGQSEASIIPKVCKINKLLKRKDNNCVGISSDQGEAETASNHSEYIVLIEMWKEFCDLIV